jgi:hypothetical protein
MANRWHCGHRLAREDLDVNGEPCGLMITQDFGECCAVSNGSGSKA